MAIGCGIRRRRKNELNKSNVEFYFVGGKIISLHKIKGKSVLLIWFFEMRQQKNIQNISCTNVVQVTFEENKKIEDGESNISLSSRFYY